MSSNLSADTISHPERGGDGNSSGDGIIFKPLCFSLSSFWVKYDPSTSTTATPCSLANRILSRFADIDTVHNKCLGNTNLSIRLCFRLADGIFIPCQISHLQSAAILWISNGSSRNAPGMSASVSTVLGPSKIRLKYVNSLVQSYVPVILRSVRAQDELRK